MRRNSLVNIHIIWIRDCLRYRRGIIKSYILLIGNWSARNLRWFIIHCLHHLHHLHHHRHAILIITFSVLFHHFHHHHHLHLVRIYNRWFSHLIYIRNIRCSLFLLRIWRRLINYLIRCNCNLIKIQRFSSWTFNMVASLLWCILFILK